MSVNDPEFWQKEFPITSMSRADLTQAGFTKTFVATITDEQMQQIASKMEDYYCENGFWDDAKTATEYIVTDQTGEDDGLT